MRQEELVSPALGIRARAVTIAAAVLVSSLAAGAQISLATAVDLAQKSSPAIRSAQASVIRAAGAVEEAKDAYYPNFTAGAGPGYAYGYPLGYPSLVNANSTSLVISFSQPDYIRAARSGLNSARLALQDAQQQVALDVSLDYAQLDYDLREMAALDEEKSYAHNLVSIEQERVGAGVDPRVQELQAELTAAQLEQKRMHIEDDADEMRQKIAHLTGLPAAGLTTVSSSIPSVPNPAEAGSQFGEYAARNSPGVAAAYASAKSKFYTAFGDERQNYRPLITFGAQYSLFQKFAGYTEYFRGFQYNNFSLGVQINVPIFDAGRRAKARESAADAVRAQADADAARNTLSEQTLLMRRTVREVAAQQRVAQLQSELAQEQLKAVDTELANGSGNPNGQAVTPRDAQQAHIQERERYLDMLDADFSLLKVQLNLLRVTGHLDSWIHSSLK